MSKCATIPQHTHTHIYIYIYMYIYINQNIYITKIIETVWSWDVTDKSVLRHFEFKTHKDF